MKSGIYLIKNNITKRVRVGSASNIQKRFSCYKSNLKNGKENKVMQKDYNWYGVNSFEFIVLEECKQEDLFKREKYYLELYEDCAMYNKNKIRNTEKKIRKGKELEEYKKIRSKLTAGENNGHNTKLSVKQVKKIKKLLQKGVVQSKIAKEFKVSTSLISGINNGIRWNKINI